MSKSVMEKEKNASGNPLLRELFQTGIYKRSQGRIARQLTFAALAIVFLLVGWRAYEFLIDSAKWVRFAIPTVLIAGGAWLSFRLVNLPTFADFLIGVEAEMNKVSWPSKRELIRASMVVIFTIFFLAAVLFTYDLFWRQLLRALQIVDVV